MNRVSQLEKALKEIKSKKSEKEKEKIVNKLFDKKSVEIEVDETKKILDQRVAEKGELLKEIQLQNERYDSPHVGIIPKNSFVNIFS